MNRILQLGILIIFSTLLAGLCHAQTTPPSAVDPDSATSGDLFWISDAGAIPLPFDTGKEK